MVGCQTDPVIPEDYEKRVNILGKKPLHMLQDMQTYEDGNWETLLDRDLGLCGNIFYRNSETIKI